MEETIPIKFHGTKELLHIIDTRKSIVEYLTEKNSLCPLIGSEIKLGKKLGKGSYGEVYKISFPGMGKKKYVVKRKEMAIIKMDIINPITLGKLAHKLGHIPANAIIQLNGGDANMELTPGQVLLIPDEADKCIVTVKGEKVYYCENEFYSEYVISVLVGELYRNGDCINFLDVFDFATCYHKGESHQYIFMEEIDSRIDKIVKCISPSKAPTDIISSVLIQTIFAIACYQQHYQLVHYDLHQENIFIEYITPNSEWRGQNLYEAEYFVYSIGDKKIYIKNMGIIVKIGDWGMGCMYSPKLKICMKSIIRNSLQIKMPTKYTPQYDIVMFIYRFLFTIEDQKGYILESKYPLVDQLYRDIGISPDNIFNYYDPKWGRPLIKKLGKLKDANHILRKGKFIDNFTTKPNSSNIIELGHLN
jgi:serine/threonine protein kinase